MRKIVVNILLLLSVSLSADIVVNNGKMEHYSSKSEYYTKVCESGNMNGCVNLGMLYITGNGVQEDHKKAAAQFEKACKRKHSKSCYHLGSMYKHGTKGIKEKASKSWLSLGTTEKSDDNGIKRDLKKAKMFFALGCMYGYAQSCVQFDLLKDNPEAKGSDDESGGYRYYTDEIW